MSPRARISRFLGILGPTEKNLKRALKRILGFYPVNIILYQKALRHRSAAESEKESNERLEYLGDAVFGAIVAQYLFQKFPYKDEGFLTKMRSKIVNRTYLNRLAKDIGIDVLIKFNTDNNARFKSINGNAFEALIGAIFLDKGFHFTSKFVIGNIIRNHVDIDELEATDSDFKSKIIHWAQREKKSYRFDVVEELDTGRNKQYRMGLFIDDEKVSEGIDFSKKRAEQLAAEVACKILKMKE